MVRNKMFEDTEDVLYCVECGVGPARELVHAEDGVPPGVGGQEAGSQRDQLHAQPGQHHLVDPHPAGLVDDGVGRAAGGQHEGVVGGESDGEEEVEGVQSHLHCDVLHDWEQDTGRGGVVHDLVEC